MSVLLEIIVAVAISELEFCRCKSWWERRHRDSIFGATLGICRKRRLMSQRRFICRAISGIDLGRRVEVLQGHDIGHVEVFIES